MKAYTLRLLAAIVATFTLCHSSFAQQNDKTFAPYFKIVSKGATTESLPLKSSIADVSILGTIADVKIEQSYQNTGSESI